MKAKFIIITLLLSFFSVQSQQEKYVSKQDGLYKMTSYGCPLTFIGDTRLGTTHVDLYDIALMPNGTLWGIFGNKIYTVNKLTGGLTLFYTLPGYIENLCLLALDNTNLLYSNRDANGFTYGLYKYNINTNAVTYLGDVSYPAAGDLVFFDGKLYMSCFVDLIRINMNSNFTAVQSINLLSQSPGFPPIVGMITVSDPNYNSNYIIGFARNHNVYRICPIDGSYQLICTLPIGNLNDSLGATATEIPIQNPIATTCATLDSEDFIFQSQKIQLFPNPVNKEGQLQIKLPNYISSEIHIKMSSMDGKELFNHTEKLLNQNVININLSSLTIYSGIYIVELDIDGKKEFLKLIVN